MTASLGNIDLLTFLKNHKHYQASFISLLHCNLAEYMSCLNNLGPIPLHVLLLEIPL